MTDHPKDIILEGLELEIRLAAVVIAAAKKARRIMSLEAQAGAGAAVGRRSAALYDALTELEAVALDVSDIACGYIDNELGLGGAQGAEKRVIIDRIDHKTIAAMGAAGPIKGRALVLSCVRAASGGKMAMIALTVPELMDAEARINRVLCRSDDHIKAVCTKALQNLKDIKS